MKIGITGHQELDDPADWSWIQSQLIDILEQYKPCLIGVSSLAIGADQYFAKAVLEQGGSLEVIVPFVNYEREFEGEDRSKYLQLLTQANNVEILDGNRSDEEAFFQAGKVVVARVDLLVAVWDGQPAAGLGGTADVVQFALQNQKPIVHLNPIDRSIIQR